MAESLILGALVGDAVSKLSETIITVVAKTWYFKSKLIKMQENIANIKPVFHDIEKLNIQLNRRKDETNMFIKHLKEAKQLVTKCEHVKWNMLKRYIYSSKLDDLNESFKSFIQIDVLLQLARDAREALLELKRLSGNHSSTGCSTDVPSLKKEVVVGFENRVKDLKEKVLKDFSIGDGSQVVLVSAAGGYGKTTLVTMLCHDQEIKEKFGENIYFVTISSTPNLKAVVKGLLKRNQIDFSSDEDAIRQWGSFLNGNTSPQLLVLDDVWSHSVVESFMFTSPGYKILVTSRTAFSQFSNNYKLELLDRQDATNLFHHSANSEKRTDITDEIVDKLVSCCKNHPLALHVIGGMLKGKRPGSWEFLSNELFKGNQSIWEFNAFIQLSLKKSLEPEIMECYMDLGLFPEDQKISATALMDIWTHLYNHDEDGEATTHKIDNLSSKNLATLLPIRKHIPAIANHCEEEYIVQHDMMRTLAIRMSSQEPVKDRERLIINPHENDLPTFRKTVKARLLSISTDERSSMKWKSMKFPNLEVFVLSFLSEVHPLPRFMKHMTKLKVLIITNYGHNLSELQNFPSPKTLAGLTSLRLDHVSISSISISILELENLKKLSLIMCKVGNSFNESTIRNPNKLTSLLEIEIDSCDDLFTFPARFCNLVRLKKLSITSCHEFTSLSEDFGNLVNLEVLRLASCSYLKELPESMRNLKKLRIIDLSHCLNLCKLPMHIGELESLGTIHVSGCTELVELPESVKDLHPLKVVCDEEISMRWNNFTNAEVEVAKEDPLHTFLKIIPRG